MNRKLREVAQMFYKKNGHKQLLKLNEELAELQAISYKLYLTIENDDKPITKKLIDEFKKETSDVQMVLLSLLPELNITNDDIEKYLLKRHCKEQIK